MASARPRVLVVEDDPAFRAFLCVTLAPVFEVDEADNGADALRVVAARPYDLVLLDVVLAEGQSGYSICQAIRESPHGAGLKIALCTGLGGVAGRARAVEAGADTCIVKPVQPSALIQELQALLA